MGSIFRTLMQLPLLRSALRPFTRFLIGAIAIPIFRFILRHVFRLQELDDELEKDLEQWFRGSLLLLAATANMEHLLFGWAMNWDWLTIGLRLLLAIGVVEAMPDQELFAVIHPGPPKLKPGKTILKQVWQRKWEILKGSVCQHLNRSSPVLAIMAAIFGAQVGADHFAAEEAKLALKIETNLVESMQVTDDEGRSTAKTRAAEQAKAQMQIQEERAWEQFTVGWVCYILAITQYLIMGLVTTRDRAMDVLSEFDRAVAQRRRELVEEFSIDESDRVEEEAQRQAREVSHEHDDGDDAPSDADAAVVEAASPAAEPTPAAQPSEEQNDLDQKD